MRRRKRIKSSLEIKIMHIIYLTLLAYYCLVIPFVSSHKYKACGDFSSLNPGEKCNDYWFMIRKVLHPSQEAVGFAAVKRKLEKSFQRRKDAESEMSEEYLPFVLGPRGVPYLVDSHHTVMALETSNYNVNVTLYMICDWSDMDDTTFYIQMIRNNLMNSLGRPNGNINELPLIIQQPMVTIPATVAKLKDDPWRALASLVRKVKHKKHCPKGKSTCFRGYFRNCDGNGHLTPFFEFRWAYFMNDAFLRGCNHRDSLWEDQEECEEFEDAYNSLSFPNVTVLDLNLKDWMNVADLLLPLCRGRGARDYVLPNVLGEPFAGRKLPGYVEGKNTPLLEDDPDCSLPDCPVVERNKTGKTKGSSSMQKLPSDVWPLLIQTKTEALFF